jgi:methylglyoxal synthase
MMSRSRPQPQLQREEGEGSFAQQLGSRKQVPVGRGNFQRRPSLIEAVSSKTNEVVMPFHSKIAPGDMRQLALIAHNNMKPAMKEFIKTYSEILKKFRITGTQTTMAMCKALWGDVPSVEYGLTCTSGPLGGDAQITALICMEDLGAIIFFVDPLSAHAHQPDIDSLLRLSNCGNIIVCPNPSSASLMMYTLRTVLLEGHSARGMIPSFFETLESPAVMRYKQQQAAALANVIKGTPHPAPVPQATESEPELNDDDEEVMPPSALKQGVEKNKTKRAAPRPRPRRLSLLDSAIDRALMGESCVFGPDQQAMLLSDLNNDEDDEEDAAAADAAAADAAPTSGHHPLVDHNALDYSGHPNPSMDLSEHLEYNMVNSTHTLDYSGHPNPLMDLSQHPEYNMVNSTHTHLLGSVEESKYEDDDSLEEEDAPIAATAANTDTDTGARVSKGFLFKPFSLISKGGRGVKNLRRKAARKLSSKTRQEQDRPSIVTTAAAASASGQSVMEREKSYLESEMLMLALKQQAELIEILKDRHSHQQS